MQINDVIKKDKFEVSYKTIVPDKFRDANIWLKYATRLPRTDIEILKLIYSRPIFEEPFPLSNICSALTEQNYNDRHIRRRVDHLIQEHFLLKRKNGSVYLKAYGDSIFRKNIKTLVEIWSLYNQNNTKKIRGQYKKGDYKLIIFKSILDRDTPSATGTIQRICNIPDWCTVKNNLEQLEKEGKIISRLIGKRKYYCSEKQKKLSNTL